MNKFKGDKKYIYWGVTAFLVIVACLAVFWVIQRWAGVRALFADANKILSPIIWGFVIAYLLTPFVKFFERKLTHPLGLKMFKKRPERADGFGRGLSVTISLIVMLGIITALFSIVLPQLYNSLVSIFANLNSSFNRAVEWANKWLDDYPDIRNFFTTFLGDIESSLTSWAQSALPQMGNILASLSLGVINVIKALANFLISLVISVYVMYSREKFIAQAKKILYSIASVKRSNGILSVLRFTNKSFMGFFSGKLLDSLIIGILCYIGCLIIGIKDSVLIAVIVGVTNIIPFFGPFIGAVPSALIVLMYSPLQCLIFILFIIVLQQFDGNILGPKILGNATGLSGFWVMFSILVGAGLLGPIGMIIGVPLFAVIYSGIKFLVGRRLKNIGLPVETDVYTNLDFIDPETKEAIVFSKDNDGDDADGGKGGKDEERSPWQSRSRKNEKDE